MVKKQTRVQQKRGGVIVETSQHREAARLFYRFTSCVKWYLYNPSGYTTITEGLTHLKATLADKGYTVFVRDIFLNEPLNSSYLTFIFKNMRSLDQHPFEFSIAVKRRPEKQIRDLLAQIGVEIYEIPIGSWSRAWLKKHNMRWGWNCKQDRGEKNDTNN